MSSLNQLGSKISNILGKPGDHSIQERAKEAIKALYATRIRQSVQKHGIDALTQVSFISELKCVNDCDVQNVDRHLYDGETCVLTTVNKVPRPVRINNDAPFLDIASPDGSLHYRYSVNEIETLLAQSYSPTGFTMLYYYINGRLKLVLVNNTGKKLDISKGLLRFAKVTYIAESPEDVITMFTNEDGQDVDLPLPTDLIEGIVYEVLKVNFGVQPTEHEVKIISDPQQEGNVRYYNPQYQQSNVQ